MLVSGTSPKSVAKHALRQRRIVAPIGECSSDFDTLRQDTASTTNLKRQQLAAVLIDTTIAKCLRMWSQLLAI
jgi:hypothetical protein